MNNDTKLIAQYLNISIDDAIEVQHKIDKMALLDWSECTEAEFYRAVRTAGLAIMGELATI